MKPTAGRIVHYVAYGTPGGEHPAGVCRAAVVAGQVGIGTGTVLEQLVVLNPTGLFFNACAHDEGKAPGTWHWPEREEAQP